MNICCKLPSKFEIANWIWNESQLLKYNNTVKYSFFDLTCVPQGHRKDVIFTFKSSYNSNIDIDDWIELNLMTGALTGRISRSTGSTYLIFNSRADIHSFLDDRNLIIKYYPNSVIVNLDMIRDIMSQRSSCVLLGFSSELCFNQLLNKYSIYDYKPSYFFTHSKLDYL